ncbi:G-protein-coupled receptor family protein [Dictyostelium discoideum AX4]|uniref:Cyclic AMP receptor-like protein D n=1 Tax=Dictyostelium discoideum TaxID=44689 RepID=CRLD_DICDI|nr:G-protein-coupled receptor family protein [Dictyostelium discoideum AX4]Q54QV5.1 RecName: Full=Cyclic AMP receptor-like protein D [Dictyostelium discoideum]EAL65667.1 G-protein-coupled receptor family protein [Dictyostelium discoideum AX4]|eukprot:XP_639029.1 G-protein-coupled receptor family protein [Dictyostelium discoideum AX4]
MSSCSSLSMDDRVKIGYGSIAGASLSIIGSIGTIILIKIRNKKQEKKLLIQRKQQLSINNLNINSGSSSNIITISNSTTSLSSNNLNIQPPSFPSYSPLPTSISLSNNNNNNKNNNQKTKVSHFIINLSIANLLASIFMITIKLMMIHFNDKFIKVLPSTANHSFNALISVCTIGNGVIGFSFISTFFWTLAISMYIYQQFLSSSTINSNNNNNNINNINNNNNNNINNINNSKNNNSINNFNNSNKSNKIIKMLFYFVCWVIPFVLGSILVSGSRLIELNSDLPWCSIDSNIQLISFYFPLIICLLATTFFTILIKYKFSNDKLACSSSSLINLQSKIIQRLILFLIVILVCWVPSLISFFISFFSKNCKQFLWLEIISSTIQSCQGILNFLSYLSIFKKLKLYFKNLKKKFNNNNSNNSNNSNNNNSNNFNGGGIFYSKGKKVNNQNSNNFYFTFSTFDFDNNQIQEK